MVTEGRIKKHSSLILTAGAFSIPTHEDTQPAGTDIALQRLYYVPNDLRVATLLGRRATASCISCYSYYHLASTDIYSGHLRPGRPPSPHTLSYSSLLDSIPRAAQCETVRWHSCRRAIIQRVTQKAIAEQKGQAGHGNHKDTSRYTRARRRAEDHADGSWHPPISVRSKRKWQRHAAQRCHSEPAERCMGILEEHQAY